MRAGMQKLWRGAADGVLMEAGEVSTPDLYKAKSQILQRANTLKQMDQRRTELQEQQRRVPGHFGELGRLLIQVDAELVQIFKNQQTPVPSVQMQQQLGQYKDTLIRSRAELAKQLTRQSWCDTDAKHSTQLIEIEVQKQKYSRRPQGLKQLASQTKLLN